MENNSILSAVNQYGLNLFILPLLEEHNLYKFCYCKDIPTEDVLWGICSSSHIKIYPQICKTIETTINETYIDVRITRYYDEGKAVSCIFTLLGEPVCNDIDNIEMLSVVNIAKKQDEVYFFDKGWNYLNPKLKDKSFKKTNNGVNDVRIFSHTYSVWDSISYLHDESSCKDIYKNNDIFIIVDRYGKYTYIVELNDKGIYIQKNFLENVTYSVCKDKSLIPYIKFNVSWDTDGIIIGKDLHLIPKYEKIELYELKKELPLFFIYEGECCGIYYDGILFYPQYDEIIPFDDCHFLICKNHLLGLLNVTNRRKILPNYQKIESFGHRIYKVQYNNLWGLVDDNGREIIPKEFNEIIRVNNHIYARKGCNLYGIAIEQDYKTRYCDFPWFNAKMEQHNMITVFSNGYDDTDSPLLKYDSTIMNLLAPTNNLLELIHSSNLSDEGEKISSMEEDLPF